MFAPNDLASTANSRGTKTAQVSLSQVKRCFPQSDLVEDNSGQRAFSFVGPDGTCSPEAPWSLHHLLTSASLGPSDGWSWTAPCQLQSPPVLLDADSTSPHLTEMPVILSSTLCLSTRHLQAEWKAIPHISKHLMQRWAMVIDL